MNKLNNFSAVYQFPEQKIKIKLGVSIKNTQLIGIGFLPYQTASQPPTCEISQQVINELVHYFAQPKWQFKLNIALVGTDFQKRIWRNLTAIEPGQTVTYGELAKLTKSSARAVGNACRKNPIPLVVPCHRVVAKTGIGGFSGQVDGTMLNLKQWLLNHEQAPFTLT